MHLEYLYMLYLYISVLAVIKLT